MADLIDRDAVIKQIAETQDKVSSGIEDVTFYRAIKIIRNAPAVNRWIPVEYALPDKKQKVLVFYKAIGEKNNIHNDVIATNWRKENGDFIPFEGYEITHWMELPEPPEKE